MANVVELRRVVDIRGRTTGIKEATSDLKGLDRAYGGVSVESAKMEKATLGVERQLRTLQARLDPAYRATLRLAESEKVLNAARAQGLITAARQAELLALEARGHTAAAGTATAHTRALAGLTAQATAARSALGGALGLSGGVAVAGVLAISAAMSKMVTETIAAQKSFAQLEAVVASTGGAAGLTTTELVAMADEMQRLTTFEDDAVIGAEAVLLRFTRIGREVFPEALQAVANMSAQMGKDLPAAATLVGKALNDPVKGLTALTKIGVTFDTMQQGMIRSMVKMGDVAGAQAIILRELEQSFGGAAAAARDTLGGSLEALGNAFGNLFEVNSEGSAKLVAAINSVVDVLTDPATIAAIQAFGEALFGAVAQFIKDLLRLRKEIEDFYEFLKNPAGVTPIVKTVDQQIAALQEQLHGVEAASAAAMENWRELQAMMADPIQMAAPGALEFVNQQLDQATEALHDSAEEAREINRQIQALQGNTQTWTGFMEEAANAARKTADAIKEAAAASHTFVDPFLGSPRQAEEESMRKYREELGIGTGESEAERNEKKRLADLKKASEDAITTAKRHADAIKDVQEQLAFEAAQLGRTAEEQEVYNRLKAAGVSITSAEGQQIAEATRQLFRLEEATKAATEAAQARKDLMADIAFERGVIGLSEEDVEIATRLRDLYAGDIPAALSSTEAAALRMNNRLKEAAEAGQEFKDAFESAFVGLFTGAIKSFDDFIDHLTKGIAQAAAKALAANITDKLFGGTAASSSLDNAATKLTSGAAPALSSAGATLSASATALEHAAGSLSAAGAAAANIGAGLSSPAGATGAMGSIGAVGATGAATGFTPAFKAALDRMFAAQPGLSVTSGFRSVARQAELFNAAIAKYGSYAAARHWVAPPGKSMHGTGMAADIGGSASAMSWAHSNASNYGLRFPMSWEPWHVELAGARGGRAGVSAAMPSSATAPAVTAAAPLPVSVVKTPAPAFQGLQNLVKSPLFQTALGGFSMGYQQQSPIMGGLSGALSGFMSAGPLGAVVGGLSGAIGGLLGNMAAEKAAMEAAQEQWKAMAAEVEDFSNKLRGKVIGDLATSFNSAQAKFDEIAKVAEAAGESVEGLKEDLAKFKRDAIDDFKVGFQATKKSLQSGLGDADPWLQASNAIAGLREELKGFIADTKTAYQGPNRIRRIQSARDAAQNFVLDQIRGDDEELTALESEVRRIMGSRKAAIDFLTDLGMSMKEASAAVVAAMNEALAAARKVALDAIKDRSIGYLQREFEATSNPDNLSDILAGFESDAQLQREAEIKAGGQAMVDLERALNAERLALIMDFNARAIEEQKQAIEDLDRSARTIVEYVNELRAGPDTTLSPTDQLAAAQKSYDAILALAQGGNADAQGSITSYADDLIKAARDMFASGPEFQEIFTQIQDQLLALPAVTASEDPVVQALVNVLNGVNATTTAVTDLETAIKLSDSDTREAIKGIVSGGDAAAIATALSGYFSTLDNSINGLLSKQELMDAGLMTATQADTFIAKVDTDKNGQVSQLELIRAQAQGTVDALNEQDPILTLTNFLLNDNDGVKKHTRKTVTGINRLGTLTANYLPTVAQRVNDLARMYEDVEGKKTNYRIKDPRNVDFNKVTLADQSTDTYAAASGGILGYPGGGIIANGTFNRDSVMARLPNGGMVMLAGGEGVINANATRMIGPSMIDLINNTGRLPANDNGRFFMEQNRVLMAGFRAMIETMNGLERRLGRIEKTNDELAVEAKRSPRRAPVETKVA